MGTLDYDGHTLQVIERRDDDGSTFAVTIPEPYYGQTYWDWVTVSVGASESRCTERMRQLARDVLGSFKPSVAA